MTENAPGPKDPNDIIRNEQEYHLWNDPGLINAADVEAAGLEGSREDREHLWMMLHGLRLAETRLAERPDNPAFRTVRDAAEIAVRSYANRRGFTIWGEEAFREQRGY